MGRNAKYPLAGIEVGASMDFPLSGERVPVACGARTRDAVAQSISNAIYKQRVRHGRSFTVRVLPTDGVVRVRRVA